MRRILLGGFVLSLGAFAPAALAQRPTTPQPARAAKLGKPVAIPNPAAPAAPLVDPTDPDVTQAGLFRNSAKRPATIALSPGAPGTPTPILTQPPGTNPPTPTPMPMPMGSDGKPTPTPTPMPMQPGNMIPPPRPVPTGMPPMVTETRDPTGRIPDGTVVPSICPEDYACPTPHLDDPSHAPRLGMHRLQSCGRNWVSAELLMWWNQGAQVPALVTTSSPAFNGIVGTGDTRVLLGGSFGDTYHIGGRLGGGHWFDDCQYRGFDWRVFWVDPGSANFSAGVPPYALLARPFNNVNPTITTPAIGAGPSAEVVAGVGVATGAVTAQMRSTLWGAEANYRRFLHGNGANRLDALVGYRYLDLSETLTITESFARIPGSDMTIGTPAVSGVITDRFRTDNHFHGGQIGLAASRQRGRWSLNGRATVAFGTVFQSADINGAQRLTFADGTVTTTPGGLLAVPGANIGHFSQTRFAVVPEVGLNLGYQVTSHMKVFVGYNFLYLSSAVRPGETIDTNIDAARVPNLLPMSGVPVSPAQPMPRLSTSGYYIQGINFGLIYRW
jgi:hypothetical protein